MDFTDVIESMQLQDEVKELVDTVTRLYRKQGLDACAVVSEECCRFVQEEVSHKADSNSNEYAKRIFSQLLVCMNSCSDLEDYRDQAKYAVRSDTRFSYEILIDSAAYFIRCYLRDSRTSSIASRVRLNSSICLLYCSLLYYFTQNHVEIENAMKYVKSDLSYICSRKGYFKW